MENQEVKTAEAEAIQKPKDFEELSYGHMLHDEWEGSFDVLCACKNIPRNQKVELIRLVNTKFVEKQIAISQREDVYNKYGKKIVVNGADVFTLEGISKENLALVNLELASLKTSTFKTGLTGKIKVPPSEAGGFSIKDEMLLDNIAEFA